MTDRSVDEQRAANEYAAKLKTGEDRVLLTGTFLAGVDWQRDHTNKHLLIMVEELRNVLKRKD